MALTGNTISLFALIFFTLGSANAANFRIVNNCPYTVWPAGIPVGGGRQLNSGQTWNLNVPAGTSAARIWGRTGCSFDGSGRGSCQSGDCGGALSCTLSGRPPATLAEYSLNQPNNLDFYDISLVDGFNLPMAFGPTNGGCRQLRCPGPNCPDAYLFPTDDTKTHSCPSGTDYVITFCP